MTSIADIVIYEGDTARVELQVIQETVSLLRGNWMKKAMCKTCTYCRRSKLENLMIRLTLDLLEDDP
jgi:hypothetical protein